MKVPTRRTIWMKVNLSRVQSVMRTQLNTVKSDLKVSERHDLAMIFTCEVCDTSSVKTVCCESYDKGVVVVRCDGCNNLHPIVDQLRWFEEPDSAEEFLAACGEE
ncbi:unnamed protein product [Fraxinus pennsylvanica]|uniref:DNL-type domain-containing protein n=1 Tax=Fraxinus pennsylvanica TaxID=56036 RepID=A0AAD1YZ91_9LAMI|nr:unnamed protein product [Fraxinus pennsylvanica]